MQLRLARRSPAAAAETGAGRQGTIDTSESAPPRSPRTQESRRQLRNAGGSLSGDQPMLLPGSGTVHDVTRDSPTLRHLDFLAPCPSTHVLGVVTTRDRWRRLPSPNNERAESPSDRTNLANGRASGLGVIPPGASRPDDRAQFAQTKCWLSRRHRACVTRPELYSLGGGNQ